jgi:hypothetical protein
MKQKTKITQKNNKLPDDKNKSREKLKQALYKKALGYTQEEIVEEYVKDKEDENNLILNKKKVSLKVIAPDISAVKTLLEILNIKEGFENLTDEELEREKLKLLKLLKKLNKGEINATSKD